MSEDPEAGSLLGPLLAQMRAKMPRYGPNDPAVNSFMEQQFASALADHAGCTIEEARLALDGLSPTLRSLTAHRPGWCLLAKTLCQADAQELVASLH